MRCGFHNFKGICAWKHRLEKEFETSPCRPKESHLSRCLHHRHTLLKQKKKGGKFSSMVGCWILMYQKWNKEPLLHIFVHYVTLKAYRLLDNPCQKNICMQLVVGLGPGLFVCFGFLIHASSSSFKRKRHQIALFTLLQAPCFDRMIFNGSNTFYEYLILSLFFELFDFA